MIATLDRVLLEIHDLRTDLVAQIDELRRERDHAEQETEHLLDAVSRTAHDLGCRSVVDGVAGGVEALIEMASAPGVMRAALVELSVTEHFLRAGSSGEAATRRVQTIAAKALRGEAP